MTNASPQSHVAHLGFVAGTSRGPRSLRTLALQMAEHLADEADRQRKDIGRRIKELRGPIPQPVIAERVGVTLRAYQAWEAGGGIAWENLGKLAEALETSEEFILYGPDGRMPMGTQLDRIEAKLDHILSLLAPGPDEVLEEDLPADEPPKHNAGGTAHKPRSRKAS